jgi:hypothetical protein
MQTAQKRSRNIIRKQQVRDQTFRVLEKKRTNSDPFRKSTSKHSLYPR